MKKSTVILCVMLLIAPSVYANEFGIDQYTKIIIHSDSTDGDTVFTDSSFDPHPIIVHGDVHHSTEQAKFGNSSIYFDGSGDYLEIPNDDDWNFGSEDFTLDFWLYPTTSSYVRIMEFGYNPNGEHVGDNSVSWGYQMQVPPYTEGYTFWGRKSDFSTYMYQSNTPRVPSYEWTHVAVVRNETTLTFFENGQEIYSDIMGFSIRSNSTMPLKIGAMTTNDIFRYLDGYLDEIRISKGIARWTENFTPPSEPYTPIPEPTTMLLLGSGLIGLMAFRRVRKG